MGLKGTVSMCCFLCVAAVWQCGEVLACRCHFLAPGPWGYWKLGACTSDFRGEDGNCEKLTGFHL